MILGIGTDLVYVPRIKSIFEQFRDRFASRILVPDERVAFDNKPSSLFLAKHFAAKEAAAKALGTGIARGVSFQDFWLTHASTGQPILSISGAVITRFAKKEVLEAHISLTDEKDYVLAFVVLELVKVAKSS